MGSWSKVKESREQERVDMGVLPADPQTAINEVQIHLGGPSPLRKGAYHPK